MKDKILDAPFKNEFHLKLQDGEEVLWENEPYSTWSFFNFFRRKVHLVPFIFIGGGWLFIILIGIFNLKIMPHLFFGILTFLFILFDYLSQKRTLLPKYIFTSRRLIFQIFKKSQNITLIIPIAEITTLDVQITSISGNNGDIILGVNNIHTKKNIDYFLEKNQHIEREYKKLLLLNVKNTPKILKLIRQARLKAKGI